MVSDCEGAAGVGAGSGVVTGAGLFTVMEPEELENLGVRNRRHSNEALL